MNGDKRVKYLFVNLTVKYYIIIQIILILALLLCSFLSYRYLRNSGFFLFKYLWLICLVTGIGETVETIYGIRKKLE